MALENPWIGYLQRTYQQAKDTILTQLGVKVPEITDHTESNLWVKFIDIFSGLNEQLGYYLDNKAREVYLKTARKFESAVKLAAFFDYRVRGTNEAVVDVTFYFDAPTTADVTIPAGTLVGTKAGVNYLTESAVQILIGQQEVTVSARQWTPFVNILLGVSDGTASQKFNITTDVVQRNITIAVGATNFVQVDTLAYSTVSDNVFIAGLNEQKIMTIEFGDGVLGAIPAVGQNITVSYFTSSGAVGNTAENTITEVRSAVTVPPGYTIKVINDNRASGGVDYETLKDLQKRIPISNRTLKRAVTKSDYKELAELVMGVEKAAVDYKCGKTVNIYIAPVGGGIASAGLLDDVELYFEDKQMVTTVVVALAAGTITVLIGAKIYIKNGYVRTTVKAATQARLATFLSPENQEISGGVNMGDIYEIIETTIGVDHAEVYMLQPQPYALPETGTTHTLNWAKELQPGSVGTINWRIIFNTSTIYQLYKNNVYLGNFNVGDTITQPEIIFTVLAGTYASNDKFTFSSYNYSGSFKLEEFSIPISYPMYMNFEMFGGV